VLPPNVGALALYPSGQTPEGAEALGAVEVHGSESESDVATLLPHFMSEAAQLGATAVVLDAVDARFVIAATPQLETYAFPCGFRRSCFRSRTVMVRTEVLTVSMRGRAFRLGSAP
jgi:hypothetical protein